MSDAEDDADSHKLNNVAFSQKLLKSLMTMYKELPCLWDKNCAAYKVKNTRHEAVTQLTELVRRHDPTATRVHVLRKIESLRACVRREHNKVRESRAKAKTADDVYRPSLWYYKLMSFLFTEQDDNFYSYDLNADSEDDQNQVDDDDISYDLTESYTQRGPKYSFASQGSGHPSPSISDTGLDTGHKNVYGHETSLVEISDFPSKHYSGYDDGESKAKRLCTEVEDEYDAIGVNVAAKLRGLPSNMRILAEKLINDVLFQAQLNGLTPGTSIATPDPFKQDPL